MNKINYVVKSAVATSLILLAATQCTPKTGESTSAPATATEVSSATLPIAYINIDSLLVNYNYAKDLNEALLRKQENSRATLTEKGRALEKEVAEFQRKVQTNAFISEKRAQEEANRLQKQQNELEELSQRLNNEIMIEQQKMNSQLNDTIHNFLKEFNAQKKYEFIFSNTMGDNILIAQPKYDITTEVLDLLNKRYQVK
ncbi:MAG: OmpH family outer membrane protein [Bacteroidales bacterium]|nr:OmpH family outer membrane protein [Bacteroidales bacterium]